MSRSRLLLRSASAPFIGPARSDELIHASREARSALNGATVWNIRLDSRRWGRSQMLHILVGYAKGGGVDARWSVVFGGEEFFQITKRLHNRLHGVAGDTGALGPREAASYGAMTGANAAALKGRLRRGDVVILHDPQTIGLAGPLAEQGARVVWRCHIGTDRTNAFTKEAWGFLAPHLSQCQAFVFSHRGFVPSDLTGSDVWLIPPSIDPFTAKNRPLPRPQSERASRPDRSRRWRRRPRSGGPSGNGRCGSSGSG